MRLLKAEKENRERELETEKRNMEVKLQDEIEPSGFVFASDLVIR